MGKTKKGPKVGPPGRRAEIDRKKVLNPFEVHVNKLKYQVLGRKMKADKGFPGVARSKALHKRKATLLQEYKLKNKNNKFLDRRIGERNSAMTEEDRMTARFTAERKRAQSKVSVFNLADEEVLTHKGQTLNEIEKFDDPRSDDDDDDNLLNSKGNLDSDFVGGAHFGGGLLSHAGENTVKSRKDLIDQLIIESKKRKAEKKRVHEETSDLTQKLDAEWKDLLPVMASAPQAADVLKPKPDSYDVALRELIFEARGKPSDKLKSVDEMAREEKERLEKLEAERLLRMQGIAEVNADSVPKHRSADDLDDDFAMESDTDEDGDEGEGSTDDDDKGGTEDEDENDRDEENEDKDDEDEDEESCNSEEDDEQEEEISDIHKTTEKNVEDHCAEGDQSESDDPSSTEDLDNLYDLKCDSSDEDCGPSSRQVRIERPSPETSCDQELNSSKVESIREDLKRRKDLMEAARKELPYTFSVPDSYEEFQIIMAGREPHYQGVIVERMVKCTHPSLGAGNKDKLATLFSFLMQHLHDVAASEETRNDCWAVLDRISPHLFDITQWCPNDVAHCLRNVLQEKQMEFCKRRKSFPGVETIIYFKIISLLFPTSDFWHPVVTPCAVFMCQILASCQLKSRQDVAKAIFLVSLFLEFTTLSKRFSPEAINTLRNLLLSATELSNCKSVKEAPAVRPIPPMKLSSPFISILRPKDVLSMIPLVNDHLQASDLTSMADVDDNFCISAIFVCLKLTSAFVSQHISLSACRHIFHPFFNIIERLSQEKWIPDTMKEEVTELKKLLLSSKESKLKFLSVPKRPKPLKLFEPRIMPVYADGKQHRPISREKQEREKLLHKIKREKKGALRELRKDRDFISKIRIKQQLKSDAERKAKVKEIFGEAAMQQGDLRKWDRSKRK